MKWLTHWSAALVTLVALSFYGFSDPYLKELLRLKSFDVVQQYDKIQPSENVAFLEIDEATIEKYGQWPFKRDVMAEFIQRLRIDGAGVIVIPILFSEKDRLGGDDALSDVVQGNGVVLAQVGTTQTNKNAVSRGVSMIGDPLPWMYAWPGMLGPIKDLHIADGVGVLNTAPEIDGVVRRVPLLMRVDDDVYPSIAFETVRVAVADPSYQVKSGAGGIIAVRIPAYKTVYTDPRARVWIRWNKEFMRVSASSDSFKELQGKIVIIGSTAAGIGSIISTPKGESFSHNVIGTTIDTIASGDTIQRLDTSLFLEYVASILLGMILIILSTVCAYYISGIAIVTILAGSSYASYHMFMNHLQLWDASWIIIVTMIVGIHAIYNRFVKEFRLRQQIKKQFETYLDPRQVYLLQKNPELLKLGGERKEMSFLFMDIVGFTPISEYYKNKDDPEGLVEVINEYLNRMSAIVLKNGGTIDKYMGDCIMAFWNAPLPCYDHADKAVLTAIECAEETERLKEIYREKGLPDINIGSGVNTGDCIVGNMGSDSRFDYSVIGDAVNLAARLEAQTRNYKEGDGIVSTLFSQYTYEQLTLCESEEVDRIKVKGKEELITIYKPKRPNQ